MKISGSRWGQLFASPLALALNAVLTLGLLALVVIRLPPVAGSWLAGQAGGSTLTITGPGVASASIAGYALGAVANPGVYTLPAAARVQDLLAAAGGALAEADLTSIDLAAHLADGQEVYVPRVGETPPLTLGGKVDLNVATAQDLHNALGISLAIARRIIAYRAAHGSFTAISQLLLVPISRSEYDRIKDLVTV